MKVEWEPIFNDKGMVYFYNKKDDKIMHTFPKFCDGSEKKCYL